MKKLEEMTPEELKELVSYTSKSGRTIYYDKIEVFSKNGFIYNGQEVIADTDDLKSMLANIEEGKIIYEIYKLANSNEKLDSIIEEKTEELLNERFKDILESTLNEVQEKTNTLFNTVDTQLNKTKEIINDADKITEYLENIEDNFKDFVSNTNMGKIKDKMELVFDEFEKFTNKQVKEFDKTTKDLKTLFEEK